MKAGLHGLPNSDNNNIYFAKWQVHQKGKSSSKLATILTANKPKKNKNPKLVCYKCVDKPFSYLVCNYTMSSLYTNHIIIRTVSYTLQVS